jgi:hypothetical protein
LQSTVHSPAAAAVSCFGSSGQQAIFSFKLVAYVIYNTRCTFKSTPATISILVSSLSLCLSLSLSLSPSPCLHCPSLTRLITIQIGKSQIRHNHPGGGLACTRALHRVHLTVHRHRHESDGGCNGVTAVFDSV